VSDIYPLLPSIIHGNFEMNVTHNVPAGISGVSTGQHVTDSAITLTGHYKMSHINWHQQTIPRPCKLQVLTF